MSAAGRPMVGLLPQGSARSDFSKGPAVRLRPRHVRDRRVHRLTADKVWFAGGAGQSPPTPGRAVLSGHSGADQPITQMLSGGQANELAGLFLFDTMYVNDAEKKAKAQGADTRNWPLRLEGKVEAYVKARFDNDLKAVLAVPAADRVAWVEQRGFRLSVVHAQASFRYTDSAERLRDVVIGWIAAIDGGRRGRRGRRDRAQLRVQDRRQGQGPHGRDGRWERRRRDSDAAAVGGHRREAGATAERHGCAADGRAAPGGRQPGDRGCSAAVAARHGVVAVQRDEDPVDHAAEFASFNVRGAIEGGLEGYKDIRELFIATLGRSRRRTPTTGREAGAVPRPHADRPRPHPRRQAGPGRAGADRQGLTRRRSSAALGGAGGFNIRRNRNARAGSATTASVGPSTSTTPSTRTCRTASLAGR